MMRFVWLGVLMAVSLVAAQEFEVLPGSYVAYEAPKRVFGVSTTVEGNNSAIYGTFKKDQESYSGLLHIPVAGFDSGNSRRDRDVAEMLKAEAYPEIRFVVDQIRGLQQEAPSGDVEIAGVMHLADGRYPLVLSGHYERREQELILEGRVKVEYGDFDLKPPVMGLVVSRAAAHLWLSGRIVLAP